MTAAAWILLLSITHTAPRSTVQAIQAQYVKYSKAYIGNDVKGILAILAPDYVLHASDGSTTQLTQYMFTLEQRQQEGAQVAAYTEDLMAAWGNDQEAVVWSKEVTTPIDDPNYHHVHVYKDVWTKIVGEWRLSSTLTIFHGK